jgi:hypothetical protein
MRKLSDRPASVLYDVRAGGREYNIHAWFDSNLDRKLSPGFLHLGQAIELAFASRISANSIYWRVRERMRFTNRISAQRPDLLQCRSAGQSR